MKQIAWLIASLLAIMPVTVACAQTAGETTAQTAALAKVNTYHTEALSSRGQSSRLVLPPQGELVPVDQAYVDTPAEKMGNGVIAATTAWVDIPKEVNKVSRQSNVFIGCTVGLGKGLVSGISRGIAGVMDIATFGLPPYDSPTAKAEYKVENPNKGYKVGLMEW